MLLLPDCPHAQDGHAAAAHPDTVTAAAVTPRVPRQMPKSVLLDLALAEYQDAREAGQALSIDEFCARFPDCQTSLRRMLDLQQELEGLGMFGPTAPADWPNVGDTCGKFVLRHALGRGAFARVFLAEEPKMGNRRVVVKLSTLVGQEADILGPFQHPNIVPVLSLEQEPAAELSALCMPYLGAATLLDVLDRVRQEQGPPGHARVILEAARRALPEPLPAAPPAPAPVLEQGTYLEGVLHLAVQLADALAAAHAHGIHHCDLKPSNVLVTPDGRALLLDFNLSRTPHSQAHHAGGTVPYMAPEQLAPLLARPGNPVAAAPSAQSDIYALGLLLAELLTGQPPCSPLTPDKTTADLLEERRQLPSRLREPLSGLSPAVATVVLRCLAYAPEHRWERAAALAAALRACLPPPPRRWSKARIAGAVAAVAAVLLLGVGLGGQVGARFDTAERAYLRGVEHYRDNRLEEALGDFSKAIDKDRSAAKYFAARAMIRMELNDGPGARSDLDEAYRLSSDAKCLALIGHCYCLTSSDTPALAAHHYQRALQAGCPPTSQIHNNIGYALTRRNRFDEAFSHFSMALQLDPNCAEALYNRAMMEFTLFTRKDAKRPPDIARAIQDIERAALLKPCGKVHVDAACLYALHSREAPTLQAHIVRHLTKAVEQGHPLKLLQQEPLFASYITQAVHEQLARIPAPSVVPPDLARYVVPFSKADVF